MKTIAERLKEARELKGWTQAQLAIAADVSTGTIGNIESGARKSKGSIPQIAKAMGVSYEWLANEVGPMLPPTGEANGSLIFSGKATGEHKINQPSSLADNANAATNSIAAKSPSPYAVTIGLMFDTLPEDQNLRVAVMGQITNAILAAKRQQATELQTAPAPAQNPGKQSA